MDTIARDTAAGLGILADSLDRFDLMRAIKRCDELAAEIRKIQLVHTENLCRIANRLDAELAVSVPLTSAQER